MLNLLEIGTNSMRASLYIYYNLKEQDTTKEGVSDSESDKIWFDVRDPSPEDLKIIAKE